MPQRKWSKGREQQQSHNWTKQQERKKERREKQEEAHKRNIKLIKEGKPTPWQQAKIDHWNRKSGGS